MELYYIIGGVILLIIFYLFLTYNKFIKLQNYVNEAFATMDVYLKKRWDLIPNIVEVVKGYATHEKETFEEVTTLRTSDYNQMDPNQKLASNEQMTTALSKIFALVESYPELKANENFLKLSDQLTNIETDIANARKYYNAVVRNLNNKVQMFPSNIIASIFKIKTAKMFEAASEEKENVKVQL